MSHHNRLSRTDAEWFHSIDTSVALSDKSKTSYKKQLRSTARILGVEGPIAFSTILEDPSTYEPRLRDIPDASRRTYLAAILSLFKRGEESNLFRRTDQYIADLQGIWSDHLHKSKSRYLSRIDNNTETPREAESRTSVMDWTIAYRKSANEDELSQETLLLAFHALVMPPLRGGDLARVRIGYEDEGNCIYRNPNDEKETLLLIRDHKTSKSFGPLRRVLSGELVKLLRENVENQPREWLFISKSGVPYSESGFSSWKCVVFKTAFGRPVTSNSLRHAYISGMDRQHQSVSDARSVARQMGHGLHTQRQYVRFLG